MKRDAYKYVWPAKGVSKRRRRAALPKQTETRKEAYRWKKRHEKRPICVRRNMKRDVNMCVTCKMRFKKGEDARRFQGEKGHEKGQEKRPMSVKRDMKRDMKTEFYTWTWKETHTCVLPANSVSHRRRRAALPKRKETWKEAYICEKRHEKRRIWICVTWKTRGAFKTKRDMKRGLYMWKETCKETCTCVWPAKGVSKRRRRAALRKQTETRKEAYRWKKRHEKRPIWVRRNMKRDVIMCVTCKRPFKKAKTRGALGSIFIALKSKLRSIACFEDARNSHAPSFA